MREVSVERRARHPGIVASSFANAALSSRLEEMPERFLLSGYQTVEDVTRIADQIRTGNHPLFPSRTRLDFFGYSIGAFLTEMLMLRTDRDDFRTSRALLFCGGSTLSGMRPVSRLIMDSVAGSTIDEYFTRRFEADAAVNRAVCWIFERVQSLGVLFRSFVAPQMFQSVREERIRSAADRITAIALAGDTVVPDSAIRQTLVPESSGQANAHSRAPELHLFDFPFPYDHEHPFPVFRDPEASEQVDEAFSRVFAAASAALE